MSELKVNVAVPHAMTIDEAKTRMEDLLTKMAAENSGMISDLQESWEGYQNNFSFKAHGNTIAGTLVVGHNNVVMTAQMPWVLSFFKGTIEQTIAEQAAAALNA